MHAELEGGIRPIYGTGPGSVLRRVGALATALVIGSGSANAQKLGRELMERCRTSPVLEASSGGGRLTLDTATPFRVPYGVSYAFHHAPEGDVRWLTVRLELDGGRVSREIEGTQKPEQPGCWTAQIPELPVDASVRLVESLGVRPGADTLQALRDSVTSILNAFLQRMYAGEQVTADGVKEFWQTLPGVAAFEGFVVRTDGVTRPLSTLLRELFSARAPLASAAVYDLQVVSQLSTELDGLIQAPVTSACALARLTTRADSTAVLALANRLRQVASLRDGRAMGMLYQRGQLPLPEALVSAARAPLLNACGGLADPNRELTIDRLLVEPLRLTRDALAPLRQAAADAQRLVVNTFQLQAQEVFPGVTSGLQRFGQLDVVNAFFKGDDQGEQVRLLATFSFYPFDLRLGGEREPHRFLQDRLVLNVGYSLVTAIQPDQQDQEDDVDSPAFTAGLGVRLNPTLSIGAGRYFRSGSDGWYFSLSGDLGSIPGLEQLFARKP